MPPTTSPTNNTLACPSLSPSPAACPSLGAPAAGCSPAAASFSAILWRWWEARDWRRRACPRGRAVLAVYLAFFTTLAGIGLLLANPISNQVDRFTRDLPHITREANKRIASLQRNLDKHGLHVHLVKQGKTALQSIEEKVSKSAGKLVSFGGALLTEVAGALFDLVLVFVLSVYMLLYGNRIGALVRRLMPDGDGTPGDDYPTLVQRAVSRYVGGQLLFSVIMGASAGLSLYVFGVLGIFPDGSRFAA